MTVIHERRRVVKNSCEIEKVSGVDSYIAKVELDMNLFYPWLGHLGNDAMQELLKGDLGHRARGRRAAPTRTWGRQPAIGGLLIAHGNGPTCGWEGGNWVAEVKEWIVFSIGNKCSLSAHLWETIFLGL